MSESPVKALAQLAGLPVAAARAPSGPGVCRRFRALQPDLGVVAAYGKLIPEDILLLPRHGMINVHASLLPKYRGAAPVHRAVIDGEAETGRHHHARGEDARLRPDAGQSEAADWARRDERRDRARPRRIGRRSARSRGGPNRCRPQQEELQDFMLCSYAPRLTKEEGLIDWTLPASYIHNRVRGLYPWPHAYTYLDGVRLIMLKTHVEDAPADAPPGTIVAASRDAFTSPPVMKDASRSTAVQLEGGKPLEFVSSWPARSQPAKRMR